jgi:uncharacterized membrane protein
MKTNVRRLTVAALGAALVCICTRVFQFPIPLGYAHLGNCMILLFAVYFDPWVGAFAGGVGSALADLLSYPEWALSTLFIKCLMGFAASVIAKKSGETPSLRSPRTFIAAVVAIVIMVMGYFLAGSVIYGSIITGATQIPGLTTEGIVGIILFYVIGFALEASGVLRQAAKLVDGRA